MDAALEQLSGKKAAWATLGLDERITILKEIKGRLTDKVGAGSQQRSGWRLADVC